MYNDIIIPKLLKLKSRMQEAQIQDTHDFWEAEISLVF